MKRDLADPELFGNEAGEDEDLEVLNSYFVEKQEFERFFSEKIRLHFVRSRKGVGKSALLKQTLYRRQTNGKGDLLVYLKASDLAAMQEISATSPSELIFGWQQRICSRINFELGASLRLGFSDDAMLLIESAELAGFRGRNIVSALFDRLKVKGAKVEVERSRLPMGDPQVTLGRVLDRKEVNVWLFIDDVDATFLNTEHERLKVSTFFSACRNLANDVRGLCIRASVRTDVWYKKLRPTRDRRRTLNLVFKDTIPWGHRKLEAFRPIHILSAGRPRWAAQLCKLAGRDAFRKDAPRIALGIT